MIDIIFAITMILETTHVCLIHILEFPQKFCIIKKVKATLDQTEIYTIFCENSAAKFSILRKVHLLVKII